VYKAIRRTVAYRIYSLTDIFWKQADKPPIKVQTQQKAIDCPNVFLMCKVAETSFIREIAMVI